MIADYMARFMANILFILVMAYAGIHWFNQPWTERRFTTFILVSTSLHSLVDMSFFAIGANSDHVFLFMALRSAINHVLAVVLLRAFLGVPLREAILCLAVSAMGLPLIETTIIYLDMRFLGIHDLLTTAVAWPTFVVALFNFVVIHVSGLVYKALKNPQHPLAVMWPRVTSISTVVLLVCLSLNEFFYAQLYGGMHDLFPGDHFYFALLMVASTGFIVLFLSVQSEVLRDYNRTYLRFHQVIEHQYLATKTARENYQERLHTLRVLSEQQNYQAIGETLGSWREVSAEHFDDEYVHAISVVSDAGLRNILLVKLLWAKTLQVHTRLHFASDIEFTPLKAADFHDMVAILLDNAVEAASESESKDIDVQWQHVGGERVLIVKNSCTTIPSLAHIFASGYTTKEDHSGIGLAHFKRIIQKYDSVFYEVYVDEGYFTMKVFLSYGEEWQA